MMMNRMMIPAIVMRDPETSDLSVLKIHPELARFALEYRQVLFCFDADHLKNRNVRQAEIRAFMLFYPLAPTSTSFAHGPSRKAKALTTTSPPKLGTIPRNRNRSFPSFATIREKILPFIKTLDRRDIELVRKELHRTQDDPAKFKELAKALAKQLNIAIGDLIPFQGGDSSNKARSNIRAGLKLSTSLRRLNPGTSQSLPLKSSMKSARRFDASSG